MEAQAMTDYLADLREKLTEIAEARGPFKLDNHEFAKSVIENSQKNAREALVIVNALLDELAKLRAEREECAKVYRNAVAHFLDLARTQREYSPVRPANLPGVQEDEQGIRSLSHEDVC